MKLVTVNGPDGPAGGVLTADGIVPLAGWGHPTIEHLVEAGPSAWAAVENAEATPPHWPADTALLPPVTHPPRNLFCVGLNYVAHYDEGQRHGATMPEQPVFFSKPVTTLVGADADVVVDPVATTKADWEAELAVVIGIDGINISPDDALDHVFGYTL